MKSKFDRIVSNPEILGGKPCIGGTRISVEIILEWIASGAEMPLFPNILIYQKRVLNKP